ncbi:hypothetical protein BLSTO_05448 [Blastocystis sp. subtype 1]
MQEDTPLPEGFTLNAQTDEITGKATAEMEVTDLVVGELPKKPFVDHPVPAVLKPLVLPEQLTVMQALDRVLRLLWVGSKRFLLLLWLLWLGPDGAAAVLHLPLSDVAVLDEDEKALHDLWEATSFELDKLQSNPACAEQEQEGLKRRHKPAWKLTYEPRATPAEWLASASKYRVAIIREEGSNGECGVAVRVAGFEPWDVHVRDLLSGRITLEGFRCTVRGRVQLRGRAGVGARVGGDDPVQQGAEGAVRGVLRSPGHLLAGHLQRVPADGAAELRAVEKHRGGEDCGGTVDVVEEGGGGASE